MSDAVQGGGCDDKIITLHTGEMEIYTAGVN